MLLETVGENNIDNTNKIKRSGEKSISFKVAMGGVMSAVCLMMMFASGFLPMLDYAIPTFAGFVTVIMTVEVSRGWALATYICVSVLCPLITPNIEASMLFILFMGYYPILKFSLDKMKCKLLSWLIKFGIFNAAVIIFYFFCQYVMTGGEDMLEGMESFGKYAIYVLWGMANLLFIIYEYTIGLMTGVYVDWFRKKILKRK